MRKLGGTVTKCCCSSKCAHSKSKKEIIHGRFLRVYVKAKFTASHLCGVEKVLSACGLVWSKCRNRLGADKAEKLVKVYKFHRSSHTVKEDD